MTDQKSSSTSKKREKRGDSRTAASMRRIAEVAHGILEDRRKAEAAEAIEALRNQIADTLEREHEAELAANLKPTPKSIVDDEPEQMTLWREIIARRERWAAEANGWEEYKQRQRRDIEEMRRREAESGIVHTEELIETDRKALELSERNIDPPKAAFIGLIAAMDATIADKSVEVPKKRPGQKKPAVPRGLAMSQLRKLAYGGKGATWPRDEAVAYVVCWLEQQYSKRGKGKNHRVESSAATLAYASAEAVLRRISPLEALDLNALEQTARAEREETNDGGAHAKIAERIVRLALDE